MNRLLSLIVLAFACAAVVSAQSAWQYGRIVDVQKKTRLVLNLGNIRKYSTQFLGNLLGLKQRVLKAKGGLKLCSIAPNLMDAVKILHLEKVFEIYDEEQEALDAF